MPKPVKKAAKKPAKKTSGTLPVPPKPKRPSDPMKAAQAILAEHMSRVVDETVTPPHGDPFEVQYRAHMAKLGAKGGKVSGAKRMEMPASKRRAIAKRAAAARWTKTRQD